MKKFIIAATITCSFATLPALAIAASENNDGGVEAEDDAAQDDPYAPDAIRCERVAITGSRARRTRVCMTNAEWADQRSAGNRNASELLDNATRDHTQRN